MADILIGNIRGPQGETGPANQVLTSVYQFCVSDTGARIPDGPWLSGVSSVNKGDWVWCKNTITWDMGPETVLYSVGYIGNDGEFNGMGTVDELGQRVDALESRVTPISKGGTESSTLEGAQAKLGITALKEEIARINDYTTGENLLRGTRDFRKGVTELFTDAFTDGFYVNTPANIKYSKEEGFTVVSLTTNSSIPYIDTSVFEVIPESTYTFSGFVRFDTAGIM